MNDSRTATVAERVGAWVVAKTVNAPSYLRSRRAAKRLNVIASEWSLLMANHALMSKPGGEPGTLAAPVARPTV